MAILDTSKNSFLNERDTNFQNQEEIFIGLDLPIRLSDGVEGWFASTSTTISAVRNNLISLLQTKKGERFLQPNLGTNLHMFLFENFSEELIIAVQEEIVQTVGFWMPFITIRDITVDMAEETSDIGNNKLEIFVEFNLTQNPNILDSVQVTIGE
jgi:phage baseplate assembly protein W